MKTKLCAEVSSSFRLPELRLKNAPSRHDYSWLDWNDSEREWFKSFYEIDIPTLTRLLTGWWVTDSTVRIGNIEALPVPLSLPSDWPPSLMEICRGAEPDVQLGIVNLFSRKFLWDSAVEAPERIGRIIMRIAKILAGEA